ncbi:hypothetical protein DFH07DRAFT_85835 [Mycena maculata]|uniref:HNH domain-containing protein n=1 Tax=Mycena maculata TaxID=230809 RepID=A0AAD7N027_9AGAR|nr:hypothetical protein DFH07DRAFT_85835 [Mycena maculata]
MLGNPAKLSESPQFLILKDCLARRLLSFPELQNPTHAQESSEPELRDFTSYLAQEVWSTLPTAYLEASYENKSHIPDDLDSIPLDSTSGSFIDTLVSYGIVSDAEASQTFLRRVLAEYLTDVCAPPPVWSSTRVKECEICEREIPLTYHHLIPRSTHAKAVKKKWHPTGMLNSVAWLCRPCHTVVHQVATNEELALNYHSVDLLLQREDIQRWGRYASKQRYGPRRG